MKCPECGGNINTKVVPYLYKQQIYLGDFEAEVCKKCGSTYFTEESYIKVEIIAKSRSIWGIKRPTIQTIETVKTQRVASIDYLTLFGDSIVKPDITATAEVK